MFSAIRSKIDDMRTLKALCERAEHYGLQDQQTAPGAEHFLLAALDLSDGTARLAFERVGVSPDALKWAVEQQYAKALAAIGLAAPPPDDRALPANSGLYHAAASRQHVMQELAATRKEHGPLRGAHVVGIIAGQPHGVAARALRVLGIDPAVLKASADSLASGKS